MSEETPETATPEVVEKPETATPEVVEKPEHAHDDLRPIVEGLAQTVSELKDTVAGLVSTGSEELHDTAPTKKPWTHWGQS